MILNMTPLHISTVTFQRGNKELKSITLSVLGLQSNLEYHKDQFWDPLLFNIYLNDIFFFTEESDLTNYANDNTLYAMEPNIEALIRTLEVNTSILVKWFEDNYFKMNADKCHLLICNHSDDLSVNIDNETII